MLTHGATHVKHVFHDHDSYIWYRVRTLKLQIDDAFASLYHQQCLHVNLPG